MNHPNDRAFIRCAALALLGVTALLVACSRGTSALPSGAFSSPSIASVGHAGVDGKASLAVSLAITKPMLRTTTLRLYAYRIAEGPLASPKPAALVALVDVSRGSAACQQATLERSCVTSAIIPRGNDVVLAVLSDRRRIVGQAFTLLTINSTSLALDAGNVPVAALVVVPPLSVQAKKSFSVGVTPLAADASTVLISPKTAVSVSVYAPPGVAPSPAATVGGAGVVASFTLSGQKFVNPITVAAVTGTMSNTARIFPQRQSPLACAPLANTTTYSVPEPTIYPNGFSLQASVASSTPFEVGLDTGSTSFLIAKSKLSSAQRNELVGPGQAAIQKYFPSKITLYGNYYLAPVGLYRKTSSGALKQIALTVPMEVFVVSTSCNKRETPPCPIDTSTAYMGVGFGRPSPTPPSSVMSTPLESAFQQLVSIVEGTTHPGWVITPDSLTIAINQRAARGFSYIPLEPFPNRPGDWQGPAACVAFDASAYQCGHMLLDIGIDSMVVRAVRPAPSPNNITIAAPNSTSPLLQYSFPYPVPAHATPPAPDGKSKKAVVFDPAPSSGPFINTGRNALAAANYLYDAGCGKVGFATP